LGSTALHFSGVDNRLIIDPRFADSNNNKVATVIRLPPSRGALLDVAKASISSVTQQAMKPTVGPRLGIITANLSDHDVSILGLVSTNGARVLEVLPNSAAVDAGLKIGDVILKIGDIAIKQATEIAAAIALIDFEVSIELFVMVSM
jgi:S1-C subfamily serine protease